MMRWVIYHLPDLACAMVALEMGFPVVLGGRTTPPSGWPRRSDAGETNRG